PRTSAPPALSPLSLHDALPIYFFLDLKLKQNRELAVACGGREVCEPGYSIKRNRFSYFAIEFVVQGQGTFKVGKDEYPLKKGSVDRKSTRLNSSHVSISYAVFC